jgi:glycine hydroxymethyltransferase
MNMLPGDTKAMSGPSGLRLGTPELTRIGMGVDEMQDVAKFFARSLLSEENPETVKSDIAQFKSDFQTVKYAIQEGPAYPEI